ncbi:endonuclease/exonuclease/phosphatase family metal-dependent hydrolase [Litoreibacter meonggei]|uniref:Endonuclease/exonuclease/phosphatase family metal-dependent hydrolase n=1 Tax=Litoreibacter meonggei TaxID=1049199 RepID=A0A497X4H9_9RHOB|nr:endonuclease/exonuclease/phosphatase family protein [Litoreibacter meonggei]RLJ60102.1 endonuclease/exonuclease/phosphatase family metal-dependent hydrolase [Litoreibacter meonggei]
MNRSKSVVALRVASYNIRKARGLDQRRDPMRVLNVINGLEADVVALQEADLRLGARPAAIARDMIARETDFEVAPVARNDVALGWHGNAVLVRKGMSVGNVAHLDLPGLEPRGAVRLTVGGPFEVDLIAAHLGLIRRHRVQQFESILRQVEHDRPTVLIGDFNEWSTRRGMEPLAGRFEVHIPGQSFHARRQIASLDRIALSKGLELRHAGVEEGPLARRASDHLPIWGDIAPA